MGSASGAGVWGLAGWGEGERETGMWGRKKCKKGRPRETERLRTEKAERQEQKVTEMCQEGKECKKPGRIKE